MGKKEQWAKEAYTVARRFRKQPQQSNLAGAAESSAEILPIQPSLESPSKPKTATPRPPEQVIALQADHGTPVSITSKPDQRFERTFRVKGIPLGISQEQAEQLFQDLLGCSNEDTGLQCCSLATEHFGKSQLATICFTKSCPPCLQEILPFSSILRAKNGSPTLIFDESFLGLTTLNSCPEDRHQVNVVALSGIGGHAFRSFKKPGKAHMWLRDELPKDLPGSYVMIWGYQSTMSESKDTKSIQDISRQLRHDLSQMSESIRWRPLIFVAHSLGGLILKKLLIDLCNSSKGPDNDSEALAMINLIRGVIFCGVPHLGLETQVISTLVKMVENQPNEPLLHSIGQDSELLDQMHQQYALLFSKDRFPDATVCCVYETQLSPTAVHTDGKWAMAGPPKLFVNKHSATAARHGDENNSLSLPVDDTHSNLVKFSPHSQHYYRIVQIMKDSLALRARLVHKFTIEERDCLQMLYPGDYKRYKNRNPERVDGTCRWVLDHQLYREWLRMDQSTLLWISADPGCGKSVLAKAIIDRDLVIPDDATFLYFFFKDDDANQRSAAKAMAALLHQLFSKPQCAFLIRHAMPDFRSMGQGLIESFTSLWDIFVLAVSDPRAGPIYCVMDALDECAGEDRKELLSTLESAFTDPESSGLKQNVKFIVTSRPYQDIERRFFFLIRLEGEKETNIIKKEIDRVIKYKVPDLSKRLRLDQRQQSLLQAKLLSVEHRTYLWLHLVLENLLKSNDFSRNKFDKMIEDLPRSVEAAYDKILSQGDVTQRQKIPELLQLIVAATRPLSVAELNLALPLRQHDSRSHREFVEEELEQDNQFKTTMRNWCGLFLTVIDNFVYLLHQTAREFLIAKSSENLAVSFGWKNSIELWKAEILMTQKCVAYLHFPEFMELLTHKNPEEFGFLNYAASTWHYHFRQIQARKEAADLLYDTVLQLYSKHTRSFRDWVDLVSKDNSMPVKALTSLPLMLATDWGHHGLLQRLLQAGNNLEATDGSEMHTPFLRAIFRNDLVTSKALANHGANMKARDSNTETALIISSKIIHGGEITQWLIDSGADLEARDIRNKTALQYALETDSEEAIQILLEAGADKESKDNESRSILSRVAESNSIQAVRTLLSTGADCHSKDISGRTPLMWAAQCRSDATDVIGMLISHGSEVNSRDNLGRTALHWAVLSSNDPSLPNIKVLLKHKAAINQTDFSQNSPLNLILGTPFLSNPLGVLRLFLASGADINGKGSGGGTALNCFVWCSTRFGISDKTTEEVVRELLGSGAEIDTMDNVGRTPLFRALEGGMACFDLAELLLEFGGNEGSRVLQGHAVEYWAEKRSSPAAEMNGVGDIVEDDARNQSSETDLSTQVFEVYWDPSELR